jgi:hypothetical protein
MLEDSSSDESDDYDDNEYVVEWCE